MRIQPRGFKRDSLYAAAAAEAKHRIERIAAMFDCSKSFVVNTIICDALHIKGQPNYETYKPKKSVAHTRRAGKITNIRQGKKRTA